MTDMHPFDMNGMNEEMEELSIAELAGVDICGEPTWDWVPVPNFDWTRFYEEGEEDGV